MTIAAGRRGLRTVVLAVAAIAVLLLVAPPSNAAQATSSHAVQLVEVNSADLNNVQVVYRYDGAAADASKVTVTENGKPVAANAAATLDAVQRSSGIVIVMDTSGSTDGSGTLSEGRNAVKALLAKLTKGTQLAVVAAGSDALLTQKFTTDTTLIEKAMGKLTPQGDGALWEGVARAAKEIKDQNTMIGSIIVITDGNGGQGVTFASAKGQVLDAGATVYAFGVGSKVGTDIQDLTKLTAGRYSSSDKAADATGALTGDVALLNGVYGFTYKSGESKGVNDLSLSLGDASTKGSFVVGSDARGANALEFIPPETSSGVKSLQNNFGMYLAVVLGLIAAALAAYAIIGIVVKDNTGLASVLQPYSGSYMGRSDDLDDEEGGAGMAQTAVVQRAVELTRQFAERRGFLNRVENALERANLPLRAAEAMFFYVAGAAVVTLLSLVITRSALVVLIVLVVAVLIPPGVLGFLSSQRKRQFESMLPDTLQLLSGTLRAGYSMMQGVEAVSQEVAEPMGRELRRVVTEARLGRPLEESLDAVAERMDSRDFAWAVMAIRIQREVGGNLSELLMTVAETMTQRERLRRDVRALTAEGRISAYILAALPPLLGIAMYTINPDYMQTLFDETIGKGMLAGGLLLMVFGFMWMQSIVKIDV